MNWIPLENVKLKTNLKESEVYTRIADAIEIVGLNKEPGKRFRGEIHGGKFRIQRAILPSKRISFVPLLLGFIQLENDGTKIYIKIRCRKGVLVLMSFVIVFLSIYFLSTHDYEILIIICFAYLLTMISFNVEDKKVKRDLFNLLEAEVAR